MWYCIYLVILVNKLCATCTSLILTKPHPIFGYDAVYAVILMVQYSAILIYQ